MVGWEIEQEPFVECVGAFGAFLLIARLLVEMALAFDLGVLQGIRPATHLTRTGLGDAG
jgi:hypothetical protein